MSEDKKQEAEGVGWASSLWRRLLGFLRPHRSSGEDVQNIRRTPWLDLGLSKTDHTIRHKIEPVLHWTLGVPLWLAVGCLYLRTRSQLKRTSLMGRAWDRPRSGYRVRTVSTFQENKPGRKLKAVLWNMVAIPSVGIVSIAAVMAAVETRKELKKLEDDDKDDEKSEGYIKHDEHDASKTATFTLDWKRYEEPLREGQTVHIHNFRTGGCSWNVGLKLRSENQVGFYVMRDDSSFTLAQMPFTIEVASEDHDTVLVRESFGDWGSMLIDGKGPVIPLAKLQGVRSLKVTVTRDGSVKRPEGESFAKTAVAVASMLRQMSE